MRGSFNLFGERGIIFNDPFRGTLQNLNEPFGS